MKKFLLIAILFITIRAGAQLTPAAAGITYGEAVTRTGAITTQKLQKELQSSSAYTGKITGTVVGVCAKKGCWMKLKNPGGEEIMVKFLDYGFFVPQDINGKEIVLEGTAEKTVTPVSKLQHYAGDAGKSKEEIAKITEPKEEIVFTATGVLVL